MTVDVAKEIRRKQIERYGIGEDRVKGEHGAERLSVLR